MSVTIKDIANELGITHSTVSRALNGRKGVGEQLRKEILATAERLGYTPNAIARGLVTKQSRTIAFIVPDFANPFFVEIAHAVNSTASARGFNTIMCDTHWDHLEELKQIRLMTEKQVDGIIIKSFGNDDSHLISLGIPVVKLNPALDSGISSIDIDNIGAAFAATEHLIKCGYQHIAYIGSVQDPQTGSGRFQGYCSALLKYHRMIDNKLVIRGEFSPESGAKCFEALLKTGLPFEAALCENDMIALGVLDRAMQSNWEIPDHFGLIGFDDLFFARLPMINLTTMSQPKQTIGEMAAALLIGLITDPEQTVNRNIILQPELIKRSTTKFLTV